MLLGLGAEAQAIDHIDDFTKVVAARDLVADLPKNLADLVFDGVWPDGPLLELLQISTTR